MVFQVYKTNNEWRWHRGIPCGKTLLVKGSAQQASPTCLGAALAAERVAKCYGGARVIITDEQVAQIFSELEEAEPEMDYHPFDGDIAADLASCHTPSDIAFLAQVAVECELFAQGMGD